MRIAVPNKGRLHEPTIDLLERAGLHLENGADRKLYADTVDPEVSVLFARAADIPEYVADGAADLGITGYDQVQEARVDTVSELLDLEFGRCRLVLAAPEDGDIDGVDDLEGGTVATEFPNITEDFFADTGVEPDIVEVTGATELTPHVEMADAIVDITSTGTTLKMNRLAVVEEVLSSSVRLFGREDVLDDPKVEEVRTALSSVKQAEGKRYLMMNVPRERLDDVRDVIPGMGGPTVMDIAGGETPTGSPDGETRAEAEGDGMVAVHAVVDERRVFETITEVKNAGASDILVTEIERLVE
ncbi:ATP phosphoribosyltransferase [Haloterrigena salinisoli]|uniref:ATP phosphoribosyltransferase n=1 Tax=Haloterrigena salinisoli TaxID=3132747 RepID=UPI0030CF8BF5